MAAVDPLLTWAIAILALRSGHSPGQGPDFRFRPIAAISAANSRDESGHTVSDTRAGATSRDRRPR